MSGRLIGVSLLSVIGLLGCMTPQTGVISAHWTPPGKSSEPIVISWESKNQSQGQMFVQLGKGGERFRGTYVRVSAGTKVEAVQTIISGWGPVWGGYDGGGGMDPWGWGPGGGMPMGGYMGETSFPIFVREYSGKVVATLFGNEGHSMRCRFTLARPQEGLLGGGVGACQSSTGSQISARF